MIAGLAAIAALIFTGASTIYTARATEAQTRQAQQEAQQAQNEDDQDAKAQAASLNVLYENGGDSVEISNSSNRAIYKVEIAFALRVDSSDLRYMADAIVGDLGPCQKKVVNVAKGASRYYGIGVNESDAVSSFNQLGVVAQFYDADGVMWWRDTGTFFTDENVTPELRPARQKNARPGSGSIEPHNAREDKDWAHADLLEEGNQLIFQDTEEKVSNTPNCDRQH
ncbi:hypothetical protein ACFWRT_18620 [Streptomyces cyaneofuscatus]|uniref:hypothetical protein n=1 Tax=Streptomyces cyaneofuscatus TaxID=66883 RepID=UPI0036675C02